MKISGRQVDGFLRNPDEKIRAVLVYGPDAGRVSEAVGTLMGRVLEGGDDPFARVEFSGATLEQDPARLSDEAAAISLMGGRRAIRVFDLKEKNVPVLERFLAETPGDAFVVVEAGNLPPRAAVRKLFEGAAAGAALPCYADEAGDIQGLIGEVIEGRGYAIDREARGYLADHLGNDRMVSRGELEKLLLYVGAGDGSDRRITLDDVTACIGDSAAISLDELCDVVAGGDRNRLERALGRAFMDGNAPVSVLRAAARHFDRLYAASAQRDRGANLEAAMKTLRPPVFFKAAPAFRAQLGQWTTDRLAAALEELLNAERQCKTTGYPAETICARTLMRLCVGARARPAR
jgi:DNA polymerase-3 subunit delta